MLYGALFSAALLLLFYTLVDGRTYNVCEAEAGSCVIDKHCPEGSKCIESSETHLGVCYCDLGSCAVDGKCIRLGATKGTTLPPSSFRSRQPLLEPEEWFLNETEMSVASGGNPRLGLQLWTDGNHVKYYAEAEDMWLDLYPELKTLPKLQGARFWDTSWLVGPTYQLVPDLDARQLANTSFGQVLYEAGLAGVEVLALAWRNLDGLGRYKEP